MVEIILRKDIQDYEARPLFGFTYRQVATGAAIAITAAGMGLAISSFTEINTLWLMLIMSVCGAIGLVGLGRIHDLKFEQWFAIWKADRRPVRRADALAARRPRLRQGESRQEAQEGDQSGEGGGAGGRRRGRGIEKTEKFT